MYTFCRCFYLVCGSFRGYDEHSVFAEMFILRQSKKVFIRLMCVDKFCGESLGESMFEIKSMEYRISTTKFLRKLLYVLPIAVEGNYFKPLSFVK